MAILKDLIVHGSSRFLNKIYADELETSAFEADSAVIKKLKADEATVVGLLDVQGQLHTNTWTNSNIATIDGCFYITPTLSSDSGKISFSSTSVASLTGTYAAVTSLYIGDSSSGSTVQWTSGSNVLLTGEVEVNGQWLPLGTLLGTLSANAATDSIGLSGLTDNRHNISSIITDIRNVVGNASLNYRNLKISLYQRKDGTDSKPLGIYMTAMGTNGKTFIDIYGGVNSTTTAGSSGGFADPNLRIGNLSGLSAVEGNTPQGWGIYTTNGYFKGVIVSSAGNIGGWSIGTSGIYNGITGVTTTGSTPGTFIGTGGISNYKDTSTYVNIQNGVITAKGVKLTGQITATSGTIGGASISNGTLIVGNANINNINASKITAGDIAAARIQTNLISAINAKVSDISALTATLGGFQVDNTAIHTKNVEITSNVDNSIALSSADFTRTINNTSRTGLRFAIGDKLGITGDGIIYASSVDLTGKITATSGKIGGINITNGKLDVSAINIGDLSGEIGGRNLILNSALQRVSPASASQSAYALPYTMITSYGDTVLNNIDDYFTYSFDYEVTGNTAQNAFIYVQIRGSSVDGGSKGYASYVKDAPIGKHVCTFKLTSTQATVGGNLTAAIRLRYASDGAILTVKNIKLEKGTKATDWTPAPQDQEAYTDDAINNIEISGRNLLLYSETQPLRWLSSNGGSLTVEPGQTIEEWRTNKAFRVYGTAGSSSSTFAVLDCCHGLSTRITINNQAYMFSIYIKNNHATENIRISSNGIGQAAQVKPGEVKRVILKGTGNGVQYLQFNFMTLAVNKAYDFTYWHPQIEYGNTVTEWSPAPEELKTQGKQNLSPFFSSMPFTVNEYWKSISSQTGYTFTDKGEGWVRIQATNNTSSVIRKGFWMAPDFVNIQPNSDYTFLFEFRNNHSTGTASGTDFYIVQQKEKQFWGNGAKKGLQGYATATNTEVNLITEVPKNTSEIYYKRFVKTSEPSDSTHWTNGISNVNGLVCLVPRCGANSSIDYEVRISLYKGEYLGPYINYVDSKASKVAIDNAAKTATNYLYASSEGLKIASANPSTNAYYQLQKADRTAFYVNNTLRSEITYNGFYIYNNNAQIASFDVTTSNSPIIKLGLQTKPHFYISDTGIIAYKDNNKKYFEVGTANANAVIHLSSDEEQYSATLANTVQDITGVTVGQVTTTDYTWDEDTHTFVLNFRPAKDTNIIINYIDTNNTATSTTIVVEGLSETFDMSSNCSSVTNVKVDGVSYSSYEYDSNTYLLTLNPSPASGSDIEVTYVLVAQTPYFTFGSRDSTSNTLGNGSFSSGEENRVSALNSFASGYKNNVYGNYGAAFGQGVTVAAVGGLACGRYNQASSSFLFSVGYGTSSTNRKSAFQVANSGNVFCYEKLTCQKKFTAKGISDFKDTIFAGGRRLFKLINKISSSTTINANGNASVTIPLSKTGYFPVAIRGVRVQNSNCYPYNFYISGTSHNFICNIHNTSSSSVTTTVVVDAIYISATAF